MLRICGCLFKLLIYIRLLRVQDGTEQRSAIKTDLKKELRFRSNLIHEFVGYFDGKAPIRNDRIPSLYV